jgi:hypothetical protein
VINKYSFGRDLEISDCGPIKALSQYLPVDIDGRYNKPQDS